jgi:hypothetical protein
MDRDDVVVVMRSMSVGQLADGLEAACACYRGRHSQVARVA